jgi:hypothetical protein
MGGCEVEDCPCGSSESYRIVGRRRALCSITVEVKFAGRQAWRRDVLQLYLHLSFVSKLVMAMKTMQKRIIQVSVAMIMF